MEGRKRSIRDLLLPPPSRPFRPDKEDGVVEVTINNSRLDIEFNLLLRDMIKMALDSMSLVS